MTLPAESAPRASVPAQIPLRTFLALVHRQVVRVGPRQYLAAEHLLRSRRDWDLEELGGALASLLARNQDEWGQVQVLYRRFLEGGEEAQTTEAPPPAAIRRKARLQEPRRPSRGERVLARVRAKAGRFADTVRNAPRGLWLGGVAGSVVLAVGLVLLQIPPLPETQDPAPPGPRQEDGPPPPPETATETWVPILPLEPRRTLPLSSRSVDPPAEPLSVLVLLGGTGLLLCLLGLRFYQLPRAVQETRAARAVRRREETRQKRRHLEGELARSGRALQIHYRVDTHPALSRQAILDSAELLGRLFREEEGLELDAGATLSETIRQGGRVTPVLAPRRIQHQIVVLIDQEKGDHPWLAGWLRVLELWRVLGVRLTSYHFQHTPTSVVDPETREPLAMDELARRTEGLPLIVFSRHLSPESREGPAPWVSTLGAWPQRAWLDPNPQELSKLSRPRQAEIGRLKRLGLLRFPLTDSGVVSLARYLASEGESLHRPAPEPLPPLPSRGSNQPLARALRKWAFAAALVPDPTWDQLEALRLELPELHRHLPQARYLERLLEWVERDTGESPELPSGQGLLVPEAHQDRWIVEERRGQKRQGDGYERRVRQLLLDQLASTRPDRGLEREWWSFKQAMHQAVLEPGRARELLGWVYDSAIAHEASRWVEQEVRNQKQAGGLKFSLADVEFFEEKEGRGGGVALRDLLWGHGGVWRYSWVRLLPVVLLLGVGGWGWKAGALSRFLAVEVAESEAALPATFAVGPEMVKMEGSRFEMGSNELTDFERPIHPVTVPGFWISRTEVTVAQYGLCVDAGGCPEPETPFPTCNWDVPGRKRHAMNCVSWREAHTYARWAGLRLPTEAEWEYAARSQGLPRRYPWGEEPVTCELAVVAISEKGEPCGSETTAEVCSKPLGNTRQGLCDMAGNVWEWVEDDWHSSYLGAPSVGDKPWVDVPRGSYRVVRGGSWGNDPQGARVADRRRDEPGDRSGCVGFRVARSLPSAD